MLILIFLARQADVISNIPTIPNSQFTDLTPIRSDIFSYFFLFSAFATTNNDRFQELLQWLLLSEISS